MFKRTLFIIFSFFLYFSNATDCTKTTLCRTTTLPITTTTTLPITTTTLPITTTTLPKNIDYKIIDYILYGIVGTIVASILHFICDKYKLHKKLCNCRRKNNACVQQESTD